MTRPARRRFRGDHDPVTFDFAPMVDIVLLLLIFLDRKSTRLNSSHRT